MALMDDIKEKMAELPEMRAVYYGGIPSKNTLTKYNYAVITKATQRMARGTRTDRWNIFIVMENYIPEEYIIQAVLPKLHEIGLRLEPDTEIKYECTKIPNTATVLEAGAFVMVKAGRSC